jgi:hypothetical protein
MMVGACLVSGDITTDYHRQGGTMCVAQAVEHDNQRLRDEATNL